MTDKPRWGSIVGADATKQPWCAQNLRLCVPYYVQRFVYWFQMRVAKGFLEKKVETTNGAV
jgi:hypothetical protein